MEFDGTLYSGEELQSILNQLCDSREYMEFASYDGVEADRVSVAKQISKISTFIAKTA